MAKIDKLVARSQEHLEEGEAVLHAVLGSYEAKVLGADSVRSGVLLATNRRLVFYAKKLTGYDIEVFPYENISSVELSKGFMGHSIGFFASGNSVKMKWIQAGDVNAFVAEVKKRIRGGAVGNDGHRPQAADPMAALRQLGELQEAGLITEEEFAEKRQEILGRM